MICPAPVAVVMAVPVPVAMAVPVAMPMLCPVVDQGQVQVGRGPGHEDQQAEQHRASLEGAQAEP